LSDFIKSRPQSLCRICGTCCRVATTPYSYDELLELIKNGDESAISFLKIFEPYSSTEEAKKVSSKTVENITEHAKLTGKNPDKIKFYRCKHIQDNNLCGMYEQRKEICDRFPSTAWAVTPPGCGFESWLAEKRDEIIEKIRRHKKTRLELEAAIEKSSDSDKINQYEKGIEKINFIINAYDKYGSKDW